jgi:glycosyltransferase involved in cell wall biosynthesis
MNQKHTMDTDVDRMTRKVVLVVCMLDSIHSARWLTQFKDQNIDFKLFPSTPNRKIHPKIKLLIDKQNVTHAKFSLNVLLKYFSVPIWFLGFATRLTIPAILLKRLAIKSRVTQIHAIELNHAGYIVNRAHKLGLPSEIKIIATNWGSDIYWFQRFPRHEKKLKELMEITDLYTAECTRDLNLASEFGFSGKFGEVLPNAGGFDLAQIREQKTATSLRQSIVIKGYESFVGRASIALEAVGSLSQLVKEYEIHVYSANRKTINKANRLKRNLGLNIHTYPKKSLSHSQVLELFKKSRVYIGVSLSDAISTSLLEAMVSGTYPIQTNTSCANEWITNGVSGSIVPPDVEEVAKAIESALTNDELVDSATEINLETAFEKLDDAIIQKKLASFYN